MKLPGDRLEKTATFLKPNDTKTEGSMVSDCNVSKADKREIKFRAWDAYRNEMFIPSTVNNSGIGTPRFTGDDPNNTVLMQFTGCFDRHNNPIYEGDILKYTLTGPDPLELPRTYIEEVSFQGSVFCVDGQCPVDATTDWDCEIIGNMYQHSTLLAK